MTVEPNQEAVTGKEKETYVSITLPVGIHHKAKILASIEGLSLSKYARQVVIDKINNAGADDFNF